MLSGTEGKCGGVHATSSTLQLHTCTLVHVGVSATDLLATSSGEGAS